MSTERYIVRTMGTEENPVFLVVDSTTNKPIAEGFRDEFPAQWQANSLNRKLRPWWRRIF